MEIDRSFLDEKLREIFCDLFNLSPGDVEYPTSPDTVKTWDSVAHVKLMVALEEAFAIEIPPGDQADMLNFELIGDIVSERLAKQTA